MIHKQSMKIKKQVLFILMVLACIFIVCLLACRYIGRGYEMLHWVITYSYPNEFNSDQFIDLIQALPGRFLNHFIRIWIIFQNIMPTVIGLIILSVYYNFGTFEEEDVFDDLTSYHTSSERANSSNKKSFQSFKSGRSRRNSNFRTTISRENFNSFLSGRSQIVKKWSD